MPADILDEALVLVAFLGGRRKGLLGCIWICSVWLLEKAEMTSPVPPARPHPEPRAEQGHPGRRVLALWQTPASSGLNSA